jgi:hypothetical protein
MRLEDLAVYFTNLIFDQRRELLICEMSKLAGRRIIKSPGGTPDLFAQSRPVGQALVTGLTPREVAVRRQQLWRQQPTAAITDDVIV